MKRNYLLIYKDKFIGNIHHRYFETIDDIKKYIKEELPKKHWEVLHKYEIKEVK